MSSKKKNARNVVQECLDRISASKKKPAKKAVQVEEPSSDDDTADRISPFAMPLKKRPAKKTLQEEKQLSDEGSSDSSPPNLEKFIFLNKSYTHFYLEFCLHHARLITVETRWSHGRSRN